MNSLYSITLLFGYIDEPIECYYYMCCRDGNYKESTQEYKAKKKPHQKPSRKLNDVCISQMYITKFN